MTDNKLMQFPGNHSIKVIGKNTDDFVDKVNEIIMQYFPGVSNDRITQQNSQLANYVSITATLYVSDELTWNAFHEDLKKLPDIKLIL